MPTKADCIKAVTAAGVEPERAAALVDFVIKEQAALRAAGQVTNIEGTLARTLANVAEAERIRLLQERRNTALTIVKRSRLTEETTRLTAEFQAMNPNLAKRGLKRLGVPFVNPFERAVLARLWGDYSRVDGARDSATRLADGLKAKWSSRLVREMNDTPGLLELLRKDPDFDIAVRQEMIDPGSTKDPLARKAAEIYGNLLEDMRQTLNDAGANIGKLEGYAPQNHDAAKLYKAGEGVWINRMLHDLDWEKTMPGLDAARRQEVLSELWVTIQTGQRGKAPEPSGNPFRKPRNLAASFQHERTLHFKDAKTAAAYHKDFGQGTVMEAVLSRIERISRRAGLMDVFGPNPESMLESLFAGERLRLRNLTVDELRPLAKGRQAKVLDRLEKRAANGDMDAAKQWNQILEGIRSEQVRGIQDFRAGDRKGTLGKALAVLMGETGPETVSGAAAARNAQRLRDIHSGSMLGSALLAALGDIQGKALWYRHGGENIFESIYYAFKMNLEGLQSAEKKEIGRQLGFFIDKLTGEFHARFNDGDAAPGIIARQVNNLFKISGLNAWTEAHKAAAGFYLSNRMAGNAGKTFAQLDKHYAATLRRAGLESRWDLIRQLATKEADGHRYIIPESARNLMDAQLEPYLPENLRADKRPSAERAENFDAARARELNRMRSRLELDLLGYIRDEVRYAVLEPEARTRASMTQGKAAGTGIGELFRAGTQFKSYPVAHFQRILLEQRWLRAADKGSAMAHAGGMVFAAVVSATMGYLSITARDLTRGKEPRDPTKLETVYASIMQGGGLGIFGDFFLGKVNRWGGSISDTLLGPVGGTVADALDSAKLAFHGEGTAARDKAIRTGLSRLPYANLWWAKAALDYGMFFHVREWMSPGSLARSEKALQKDFNQRYLKIGGLDLAPSRNIQRGGGFK